MAIIGGGERDLTIRLFANVDDFKRNMRSAEKDTSDFSGKVIDGLGKVGLAVATAGAAIGSFAIKLGVDSVKAAIEANKQQERLAALLENTGGATQRQIQLLNAQAQELAKVGVATKENITITQSQLATFDLMGGTIAKLTPAIIDYVIAEKGATASTDDFKSMTNGLAQALNGNFASLTATGFVLDKATKELIKTGTETERAAALVDVLNSTYKGFNETAGETYEGQLIMLRNAFNDATAAIGEALLPTLLLLVEAFKDNVLPRLVQFIEFVVEVAIPAIEKFFVDAVERLTDAWGGFDDALKDTNKRMPETGAGIGLIGKIAGEIALSIPKGIVFALELLGKTLEFLVRVIAAAVLAFRRDYVGAMEVLTGKTNEATEASARMHLEFQKLTTASQNAGSKLADAYRQMNYYNGITKTAQNETRDLNTLIEEFKNLQYENIIATDKSTEGIKRNTIALKESTIAREKRLQVEREAAELAKILNYQDPLDYTQLREDPTGEKAVAAARAARLKATQGAARLAAAGANLGAMTFEQLRSMELATGDPIGFWNSIIAGGVSGLTPSQAIAAGFGGATPQQLEDLARFGRGGSGIAPMVINVNGTVLDPEGVARAIQDVLQGSSSRGGAINIQAPIGVE